MALCDYCDDIFEPSDRRAVRLARPSDPSDLTTILWLCPACGEADGPSCKTEANWDRYIESPEARAAGHLWLS
jgi:hypothetical protein